jgi:intein/homing endonuclease
MEDGSEKNVERVKVGDRILSYNTETDEPEIATVEETMSRKAKEVLVLETDEGELRLTPEHPVWTKRGWVKAGQLTCDDEVLIW